MPLGRLELRLARVGATGRKDHLTLCVRKRHIRHACLRMHRDPAISCWICLRISAGVCSNPPAIASDRQAFSAAWNCGECTSIGSSALRAKPPPGWGSGKFGTPCARMQELNASSLLFSHPACVVLGAAGPPPHAAS
jgi:hypothetical protein